MEPRFGDRGTQLGFDYKTNLAWVLQWSRGSVTAERERVLGWPRKETTLQWSRGSVTAERSRRSQSWREGI